MKKQENVIKKIFSSNIVFWLIIGVFIVISALRFLNLDNSLFLTVNLIAGVIAFLYFGIYMCLLEEKTVSKWIFAIFSFIVSIASVIILLVKM